MARFRVLLVDDHALFREGLTSILAAQPDMEVVGEANDGPEALVKARTLVPDLILMDIAMPGGDGLEALRQIKQELAAVTVVMLTAEDDEAKIFEAIKYGAQGFLLKNMRTPELLSSLRGALRGEAALTRALAGRMLEEFRRMSQQPARDPSGLEAALTAREQAVLNLVGKGATDKGISEALSISVNTVKSHLRNILTKLHVNSRREAARYAQRKERPE